MNIAELLKIPKARRYKDPYGYEIEVEGSSLPQRLKLWGVTRDGSLRGDGSREYVLNGPKNYLGLCQALNELKEAFRSNNSRIRDTVRAGVHCHINVQELSMVQLFNFITTTIVVEGVLAEYCGKSRIGNLFCLRTVDANYLVKVIQDVAKTGNLNLFHTDDIRYAFFNLKAVVEHGSVEFRGMRSTTEMETLKNWAKLLKAIRDYSSKYDTPIELIDRLSSLPREEVLSEIFGKNENLLRFTNNNQLLDQGFRTAREVAVSGDWEALGSLGKNNPFAQASDDIIPATLPAPPYRLGRSSARPGSIPDGMFRPRTSPQVSFGQTITVTGDSFTGTHTR